MTAPTVQWNGVCTAVNHSFKVHVVTKTGPGAGCILDRLLADLVHHNPSPIKWTVGAQPDPRVDINYWWPYLTHHDWAKIQWAKTRTAAWFTHRDTSMRGKARLWDEAAAGVDLRLTVAQQYADQLTAYGLTSITRPAVDVAKFVAGPPRAPHGVPVVGLSGYVYSGGRKGEQMIPGLVQALKGKAKVIASGKRWPVVPVLDRPWAQMQDYLQGLAAYVCTATIEGIPMPPLEAMACGVPVVVPAGVGMIDQLPDLPGIHRYPAGDQDGLIAAVKAAITQPFDPVALRDVILGNYTRDHWQQDHLAAFNQLLGIQDDVAPADKLVAADPPVPGRAGVFLVAYGGPSRDCAATCIQSIKQHTDLPVCLVSTDPLDGADVFVQVDEADIGARSQKTRIYDLAPSDWQVVIYLDADTELLQTVQPLVDVLMDGWDVVFCPNPGKYVLAQEMVRPDNKDECKLTFAAMGTGQVIQLNGGVFGFRRGPAAAGFFRRWHAEWERWGKRDQAALDRALYADPIKVWLMSTHYNRVDRYEDPTDLTVVVHHPTRARRWTGLLHGHTTAADYANKVAGA